MKRKRILYSVIGLLVVLIGALAGFVAWAGSSNPVMDEAIAALESDATVTVEQEKWIVFRPTGRAPRAGFIFYPGGRVDARAYAPLMRTVAAEGYLTVIVPMPLNLAVLDVEAAAEVIAAYPDVERWAIGGHSLGGAMAASYTYSHPDQIDGLVLYASYPAESNSLAHADLPVMSIYGTRDGRLQDLEASTPLLPGDTTYVVIEGGNHAQFGYYGLQHGDGEATITWEAQQEQSLQATLDLLDNL